MILLDDLLSACGGHVSGSVAQTSFSGWAYDSRRVVPGECFVAIRTERGDGHDYVAAAIRNGATGILCEREPVTPPGVTCILVPDTRVALRQYATWRIRKYQPEVIGITGSVGKTSTQQAIAALLRRNAYVFDNHTYNDLFGLPLALAGLEAQQHYAVLELASGGFGEVAELCRMVMPRIAVVTNVALAHMRAFGTLDAAAGEYSALIRSLPDDGIAILNIDDPRVRAMATLTTSRILTYGYTSNADVSADQIEPHAQGTRFTLVYGNQRRLVRLHLLGLHHVYTALAAAAVGLSLELHIDDIVEGIEAIEPLPGRLRPVAGREGSVLLDDSYSASPPSVLAALDLLALQPGKRIAVLGDMLGLGPAEDEGYRMVAGALASRVDHVITYGDAAERLVQLADLPSTITLTHADAAAAVRRQLADADAPASVLVKGSEGMRTEAIVELLMAHPENAPDLLVRQAAPLRAPVHRPVERPAWIEVDLDAIAANARKLKGLIGPRVELMAILKADAYGHGARRVARTALLNGATWLGTATLSEALALRESDIHAPTLVLSYVPPWQVAEAVRHDLRISLFSLEIARQLGKEATLQGKRAQAHLKVDTGMGRLGILPADVPAFMREVAQIPNLEIEGIYTHFATADDANLDYAHRQLSQFNEVLEQLDAGGYRFKLVHAANSAATLRMPQAHFDMVRCGIALYGLPPSEQSALLEGMGPALAFKAQVAQVKQFPPGSCISYGCRFVTQRESTIAVLPVGYGDGFRRTPNNWGYVLIHGQPAPITGVVCMDMCMVDVTDIPGVRPGDEAVLIGRQGDAEITVPQIAKQLGTISYEVISELLARVPREPV